MGPQIFVQAQHIQQEGVDIDSLHAAGARLPRVDRKVIDHVLHGSHLGDDGLRSPDKGLFVRAVKLARELHR